MKLELVIGFMDSCFLIRIMFQDISIMRQMPVHVYAFV